MRAWATSQVDGGQQGGTGTGAASWSCSNRRLAERKQGDAFGEQGADPGNRPGLDLRVASHHGQGAGPQPTFRADVAEQPAQAKIVAVSTFGHVMATVRRKRMNGADPVELEREVAQAGRGHRAG